MIVVYDKGAVHHQRLKNQISNIGDFTARDNTGPLIPSHGDGTQLIVYKAYIESGERYI
jgi:hypothetical protein